MLFAFRHTLISSIKAAIGLGANSDSEVNTRRWSEDRELCGKSSLRFLNLDIVFAQN